MIINAVAIAIGAALGAWLRWLFAIIFNPIFPTMPLGTLLANLTGGLLIGLIIGATRDYPLFTATFYLAFVTGFLGSLTTFSTFSGETAVLIMQRQWGWVAGSCLAHLGGSLLMTLSGIYVATTYLSPSTYAQN